MTVAFNNTRIASNSAFNTLNPDSDAELPL